jgi:hypothetical protein
VHDDETVLRDGEEEHTRGHGRHTKRQHPAIPQHNVEQARGQDADKRQVVAQTKAERRTAATRRVAPPRAPRASSSVMVSAAIIAARP